MYTVGTHTLLFGCYVYCACLGLFCNTVLSSSIHLNGGHKITTFEKGVGNKFSKDTGIVKRTAVKFLEIIEITMESKKRDEDKQS